MSQMPITKNINQNQLKLSTWHKDIMYPIFSDTHNSRICTHNQFKVLSYMYKSYHEHFAYTLPLNDIFSIFVV